MRAARTGEPDGWGRIDTVSPTELAEPMLQLHWAAQLVASAGQTFVEPRSDDSHRAMSWSDTHSALVGAPFAGPYPFRVGLRPRDLTALLLDRTDQTLAALPLLGRPRSEGYDWLALAMATYLGGPPPRIERPEYDVPDHPVGHGSPFGIADDALVVLTSLLASAAELLDDIAEHRTDASRVRCWPHHFDLLTRFTVEGNGAVTSIQPRAATGTPPADDPDRGPPREEAGAAPPSIGVGLAPKGCGMESWFWYVTPHPHPEAARLRELAGPGAWHTEGWTGAVLPGAVVTGEGHGGRRALVRAFLVDAVGACEFALAGLPSP